jgi:hypothetical protein
MTSLNDTEAYKKQAEVAYQSNFELLKSARSAQIEYGRWLINTLWLMHSGAIVGLLFKAHAGEHPPPYSGALFWFVAGIVSAFVAAFAAWWNFTFAAVLFHRWADVRMLHDPTHWPAQKPGKGMVVMMWIAIMGGVASLGCLVFGSIAVWRSWV